MAGHEPEGQVDALPTALAMDPHPFPILDGQPGPEIEVPAAKRGEGRQEQLRVIIVLVELGHPEGLVVADDVRLVLCDAIQRIRAAAIRSESVMWAMHSSTDHSPTAGRLRRAEPAARMTTRGSRRTPGQDVRRILRPRARPAASADRHPVSLTGSLIMASALLRSLAMV